MRSPFAASSDIPANPRRDGILSPLIGCRTGLERFDEATSGLSGMTVIAGPPGSGRSALGLALTRKALAYHPGLAGLVVSLTLHPDEQNVRLEAMESGIPVSRIRSGRLDASERQAYSEANARLSLDVRPRLRIVGAAGPEPADPDTLTGRPFDVATILEHREQLVRATGATGCLIVVDDFPSIGVPRDRVEEPTGYHRKDYQYDPDRFHRLDRIRRVTANSEWPAGGPLIAVVGIRTQARLRWPYQVRGTSMIVETAACVAFLEPQTVSQRQGTQVQRLTLHVTKARNGWNADIPVDFDVGNFTFAEVADRPDVAPAHRTRRSASS